MSLSHGIHVCIWIKKKVKTKNDLIFFLPKNKVQTLDFFLFQKKITALLKKHTLKLLVLKNFLLKRHQHHCTALLAMLSEELRAKSELSTTHPSLRATLISWLYTDEVVVDWCGATRLALNTIDCIKYQAAPGSKNGKIAQYTMHNKCAIQSLCSLEDVWMWKKCSKHFV